MHDRGRPIGCPFFYFQKKIPTRAIMHDFLKNAKNNTTIKIIFAAKKIKHALFFI